MTADSGLYESVISEVGRDKRICFVSGNFNVLHPGHMRLLKFAAELSDFLFVGVNMDTTPGVTVPGPERLANIRELSLVKYAVLLDEPAPSFIAKLKPAIVVKGREFEGRENPEQKVVDSYGGRLVFGSGETQFVSYSLLDEEFADTNRSTIVKPSEYPQRHGFTLDGLRTWLKKVEGIRVLVIGDLIIDDYITCDPLGMSQEDPTIVVTPIETKTFVGGAGVVSAHARGLGASVQFFTVVGADDASAFAYRNLQAQGIGVHAFTDDTRPTTRKQRYRAAGKTLLRVNHLRQHAVSQALWRNMLAQIEERLPHTDLILFSDFNYGCLPQPLVEAVVERARARKIPMAADSQASSQISDISRFKGMSIITPTEREARLALRDTSSGLAVLANGLVQQAEAEAVIITLGSEGLLVHGKDQGTYYTDKLPAMNKAPKDVAGAGDSLFTATSLALCAGAGIWESVYLGSIAAACQTGRVGNAPLKLADLLVELGNA
ncbi:MAG TPA: PfkB family carbohydrate kinase [Hyphomicrobiaceae bacterium]|nr:PfkB family carbohydrate kinase [Hyphomicrobiaceae bacterium]